MVIILFCEVRKRKDIAACIDNSLCTALYHTIRTYLQQSADMLHYRIRIFALRESDVHSMKPVAKGTRSIKPPLSVLPT